MVSKRRPRYRRTNRRIDIPRYRRVAVSTYPMEQIQNLIATVVATGKPCTGGLMEWDPEASFHVPAPGRVARGVGDMQTGGRDD